MDEHAVLLVPARLARGGDTAHRERDIEDMHTLRRWGRAHADEISWTSDRTHRGLRRFERAIRMHPEGETCAEQQQTDRPGKRDGPAAGGVDQIAEQDRRDDA